MGGVMIMANQHTPDETFIGSPRDLAREERGQKIRRVSSILVIILAITLVPCVLWALFLSEQNTKLGKINAEIHTANLKLTERLDENRRALDENKSALQRATREIAEVRAERDRLNELVLSQHKMLEDQAVVIAALEATNTRLEAGYRDAVKRLQWARVIMARFAEKLAEMGFNDKEISVIRYNHKPDGNWKIVVEEVDDKVWIATRCIEERPDQKSSDPPASFKTTPRAVTSINTEIILPAATRIVLEENNGEREIGNTITSPSPDDRKTGDETADQAVQIHKMAGVNTFESQPEPNPDLKLEIASSHCEVTFRNLMAATTAIAMTRVNAIYRKATMNIPAHAHATDLTAADCNNMNLLELHRKNCSDSNIRKLREEREDNETPEIARSFRDLTRDKPDLPQHDPDIGRNAQPSSSEPVWPGWDTGENQSRSADPRRSRHRHTTATIISHHAEGAALTPSLGPLQFLER